MKLADLQPRVVRLLGMTELRSSEAKRAGNARHYWKNREKINAARRRKAAKQHAS